MPLSASEGPRRGSTSWPTSTRGRPAPTTSPRRCPRGHARGQREAGGAAAGPEARARIHRELAAGGGAGLAADILVTSVLNADLKSTGAGRSSRSVVTTAGPADALMDLLIADRGNTARVTFKVGEDGVRNRPPASPSCPSARTRAGGRGWHPVPEVAPADLGLAPRILGHYVRQEKLPARGGHSQDDVAARLACGRGSRHRAAGDGRSRGLRSGACGRAVHLRSPSHYSEGIPYVAVNGQLVVDGGALTAARPGRPLLGPGYRGERIGPCTSRSSSWRSLEQPCRPAPRPRTWTRGSRPFSRRSRRLGWPRSSRSSPLSRPATPCLPPTRRPGASGPHGNGFSRRCGARAPACRSPSTATRC